MGEYVLMKRGLYWRPDACGYTGVLADAGRYTKEQAEARVCPHPKPEVTAHRIEDCAEFSPSCWPETQIAVLRARLDRMKAAGDRLQYELEMERESRGSMRPENLAAIRVWKDASA